MYRQRLIRHYLMVKQAPRDSTHPLHRTMGPVRSETVTKNKKAPIPPPPPRRARKWF
jgi:hypothetical protein